jgi:hypothetical protein
MVRVKLCLPCSRDSTRKHSGGWYNMMTGKVADNAAAEVTHVWLPPPSHSGSNEGPPPLFTLKNTEDSADTGSDLCPCLLSEYQTVDQVPQ